MNKKRPNIFKLIVNDIYLSGYLYGIVAFTTFDIIILFSEDASVILNGIFSFFVLLFVLLFTRRRNILINLFINGILVKAKIIHISSSLGHLNINSSFYNFRIFFEYSIEHIKFSGSSRMLVPDSDTLLLLVNPKKPSQYFVTDKLLQYNTFTALIKSLFSFKRK